MGRCALVQAVRLVAAVAVLTAGCTGAQPPSVSPLASASAAPSTDDLVLQVIPETSVGRTVGGQRVVFLATVGGSPAAGPADVTAAAAGASVSVEPPALLPGVVGEVTVEPAAVEQETELAVTISARRGGVEVHVARSLQMSPGEDALEPEARDRLAPFLRWLGAAHPELALDEDTLLESTPGSWVLVVNHYQFYSPEWEIGLDWHVMIPPDDWARIYLRRRWTEDRPSRAFEISSVSAGGAPHEIEPPDAVWR